MVTGMAFAVRRLEILQLVVAVITILMVNVEIIQHLLTAEMTWVWTIAKCF